jgi:signal transduction histidine kinase
MGDGSAKSATDDRFSSILHLSSHELRSPLGALQGYIRMLLQEKAGPLSGDQRELLDRSRAIGGQLAKVLDEISDLARIESGEAKFNRDRVDLTSVLSASIKSIPAPPERDLTVRLLETPPVSLTGDRVRLEQAFRAILHALLRELVTGTELAVRPEAPDDHSAIRIAIAEPSRMGDVMEADQSSLVPFNEYRGGTGLAVPIAARILDAHGGRILAPPPSSGTAEDSRLHSRAAALVILPAAP